MTPHFLILAGGEGNRLGGVRKAALRLNGVTLLERVAARMRADKETVLVSTGPSPAYPISFGIALPDLDNRLGGPLAGIVAAVNHLRARTEANARLVTVAVDTPFLPEDYISRLLAELDSGVPAAYAAWDGNAYPTNAAWRLDALQDLPEQVANGVAPNSPKTLLAQLGGVAVDWSGTQASDPFTNLNTLADLVDLARRARVSSN